MAKPGWFEWLTVVAIVAGPVLALFVQRALDWIRERKKRRADLYLTLMSTRAQGLTHAHVQALNSIDVLFNRRWRDRKIRAAWQKWLAHVNTPAKTPSGQPTPGWDERLNDLKVELYQAIGAVVGYRFSIDQLKRQTYLPIGHVDIEKDLIQIRQTFAKALMADGLKVKIVPEKQEPEHSP